MWGAVIATTLGASLAAWAKKDTPESRADGMLRDGAVSCRILSEGAWRLKSSEREACVGRDASGADPQKQVCNEDAKQTWSAACASKGDDVVLQASPSDGSCLEPAGRSKKAGTAIARARCEDTAWQRWHVARAPDGKLLLRNQGSSLCLDFDAEHFHYGEGFIQERCRALWNQLWSMQGRTSSESGS
jgi:hypothetical protein